MIKAFIFDLGNVVLNFERKELCRRLAENSQFRGEDIDHYIWGKGLDVEIDSGRLSTENLFKNLIEKFSLRLKEGDFFKIWKDAFTANRPVWSLLEKLKGKYKLVLLSNTQDTHFEHVKKKFKILGIFDEYVISYILGLTKPQKEIFIVALKKAQALPHECVFIDDHPPNIEAAKNMGINSILYDNFDSVRKGIESLGIRV
jgi:putative hydrolase of the HAD superfamily